MKNHYKFWIGLSFLLIFTAGIFSGVLLDKYVLDKQPSQKDLRSRDRRRPAPRFPTLEDMAVELQLSAGQQERFQEIFNANEQRLDLLGKEIHKRFGAMRMQFLEELKSVLDEEQTKKFDAMIEKYLEQRKAEYERRRQREQKPPPKQGAER